MRTAEGAWVHLDGPRVDEFPKQLFVIGGALGSLLDTLEGVGAPTRVVVLEPDPGVAALMLARRDWQAQIGDGRLRVLVGPDYQGASRCARDVLVAESPVIASSPVLQRHRPDLVRRAEIVARRMVSEARSNADARRRFAGRYLVQTLQNVTTIAREGDAASLDGRFRGRPAVLVAAGPSLDETLPALADAAARAVVIAADTALGPLVAAGIRPHLVVAVDPAETNARHLTGVSDVESTCLVAEGSVHPTVFPSFAGRTFTFKVSQHEPWPWLRTLGLDRGGLRAWGSVLTSAFDLALRMGCDPIVFAGADLAYTHDRPYCRGTMFESLWAEWHHRGSSWDEIWALLTNPPGARTMPDLNDRPVRTAPHLLAFRNWLLGEIAATADRRLLNATGGGVLYGPRLTQTSLTEALQGAPELPDASHILAQAHAAGSRARVAEQAASLVEALRKGEAEDLLARWIGFTADTVSADDIIGALSRD